MPLDQDRGMLLLVMHITFTSLAILVVTLRIVARILTTDGLKADDLTMLFALVCSRYSPLCKHHLTRL